MKLLRASLTALMVSQLGNIHCVTFGSPRVGNIEFAKLFNATVADINGTEYFSCRFTTDDDPVPQGIYNQTFEQFRRSPTEPQYFAMRTTKFVLY